MKGLLIPNYFTIRIYTYEFQLFRSCWIAGVFLLILASFSVIYRFYLEVSEWQGWTRWVYLATWITELSWWFMSFTLPGLLTWQFRIVLIGQHVVLEASSDSQRLSTILDPTSSRIRRGYDLIQSPQCALINDCPAWWLGSSASELNILCYLRKP